MGEHLSKVSQLIEGFHSTALISTAVRTGIFDQLGPTPRHLSELVEVLELREAPLRRFIRGLASIGLVAEHLDSDGNPTRFSLTEAGLLLRPDADTPFPLYAALCETQYLPAFLKLESMLRDGLNPFESAFGKPVWQYRQDNPDSGALFNQWLNAQSSPLADDLVALMDFSPYKLIADIGGGKGVLLSRILQTFPGCRGILAEQASVLQEAKSVFKQAQLQDRCVFEPIDFFESVPESCDAYLLKSILHDWDDAACQKILRSIRKAMSSDSHLFIIERVIPAFAHEDPQTIWLDLLMMCVTGGQERSSVEYEALLTSADLCVARSIKLGASFRIMDVVRA